MLSVFTFSKARNTPDSAASSLVLSETFFQQVPVPKAEFLQEFHALNAESDPEVARGVGSLPAEEAPLGAEGWGSLPAEEEEDPPVA